MDVISGLTYIDLIRNEPLVSTSLEVIPSSFLRDKPIPMSSWPTMAVAQPHRRKGSGGGAGWGANIRVDTNGDPLDFCSAMEQDYVNWHPAVMSEIESLMAIRCFEITFLPPGKTAIGCRWVFKRKMEARPVENQISNSTSSHPSAAQDDPMERIYTRYKARIVAKGFEQCYGVNYWDTFAPTPRLTTLRMLIALAAHFKWEIHQLDISTAFLNANLDAEVYMQVPEGMEDIIKKFLASKGLTPENCNNQVALRLLKSIYGLKQSPHEWNKDIDTKLKGLGFRCCEADPNLYIPTFENGCFLLLYVDDILLLGPSDGISNVKRMIMPLYKMKDLGPAIYYLGIDIQRLPNGRIKLSQTRYIERIIERFGMMDCHGTKTPMKKDLQDSNENLLSPEDIKEYQSVVGALNWASVVTRPDISYAVSRLSRFLTAPAMIHKEAAKHCLRYLAGTKNLGLIYGTEKSADIQLFGYTDSNFAADTSNRRSTSILLFSKGLLYIGKANSNHWSPGQLMRPSMSEWQQQVMRYRTCGNYLPT